MQETWVVTKEKLEETNVEGDDMVLKYENETQIRLSKDSLKISGKTGQIPKIITNYEMGHFLRTKCPLIGQNWPPIATVTTLYPILQFLI